MAVYCTVYGSPLKAGATYLLFLFFVQTVFLSWRATRLFE